MSTAVSSKQHRHHYGVVRYNKEEGIPLIETNSTGGEPVQEKVSVKMLIYASQVFHDFFPPYIV